MSPEKQYKDIDFAERPKSGNNSPTLYESASSTNSVYSESNKTGHKNKMMIALGKWIDTKI